MSSQEINQGNPEIGMKESSLEAASESYGRGEHPNSKANLKPFTSGSDDFFNTLDQEVNGGIRDKSPEVTQNQNSGPEQVTHANNDTGSNKQKKQSANSTDWEKRYKDSSREAVKWREAFSKVEPFVPILDALKSDSGLVKHVQDYFEGGGAPAKTIQDKMGLDEDFVFDQQEAMTDPQSDSARVMNAHVDSLVQQRMSAMIDNEKKRANQMKLEEARKAQEAEFMKKHNMSEEDFANFKAKAKNHKMTLDDINYIVNKDQMQSNVAASTKQDMMNQMKNVRNMPTSASGANSQKVEKNQDREVFENILGFDGGVDNLFG
tara:strand:+ start:732 stop:1691 length:960 start_codon:yes stop_codon:yes gene_type:complete